MSDEGQIIGETDFKIIDTKELEELKINKKKLNDEKNIKRGSNLRDDLIELGLLEYESLTDEEKKVFDELKNEKRNSDFYDL